jgi:REP element-mobilizing transposase RayT
VVDINSEAQGSHFDGNQSRSHAQSKQMESARPRAGKQQCQTHVQRFSLTGPQAGRLYRSRETKETSSHADSFRENPIVFLTTCTAKRRKLLARSEVHELLRGIWERSAKHNCWWVGHYILMPDHLHLFARPGVDASPMATWVQMWKGVSSRWLRQRVELRWAHRLKVCVPPLVAGPSCSKHSSIVK